jgi:hypothetical protein
VLGVHAQGLLKQCRSSIFLRLGARFHWQTPDLPSAIQRSINKHAACAVVLSVRRIRDAHDVEFCG